MTTIIDEQISELAATARPLSLVLLRCTPARHQDGAEAIEREHQRRLVSLRADGVIALLSLVLSDSVAGIGLLTVPVEKAEQIMADDPCVSAGMQTCETYPCLGFPGDTVTQ